jgi:hypothetical protein|tara:strand:- start:41 stop:490 length:450 start_codon:yes stop_codon:yes gene_type:complete
MPKDDIKLIKLDPLAEKLDRVGFKGGASKSKKLSKGAKEFIKDATRANLRYSREVSKSGRAGMFGPPTSGRAAAKELKTGAKEQDLKIPSSSTTTALFRKFGDKPYQEARKYLKKKKVEARKQKEFLRKRGLSTGGLIKGFPKLAKRGY